MAYEDYSSDGAQFGSAVERRGAPRPAKRLIALCSPAMGSGKSVVAEALRDDHGFVIVKFAGTLKRMIRAFLGTLHFGPARVEMMVDGSMKQQPIVGFQSLLASRPVATMLDVMTREMLLDIGYPESQCERLMFGDLRHEPLEGIGASTRVILYGLNKWVVDCLLFRDEVTPRWLQQSLGTEFGRDCIHPDLWRTIVRMKVRAAQADGAGRDVVIDDMRFPNELDLVVELGGTPVRIVRPGVAVPDKHPSEGQLDDIGMLRILNDGTVDQLRGHARTLAICPLR